MRDELDKLVGVRVIVCGGCFSVVGTLEKNRFTTGYKVDNVQNGTALFDEHNVAAIRDGKIHPVILIKN